MIELVGINSCRLLSDIEEQMFLAAARNEPEGITDAVSKGASVIARADYAFTVVAVSALHGANAAIERAHELGCRPERVSRFTPNPILWAQRGMNLSTVDLLLELGWNPNQSECLDDNPVAHAVRKGDLAELRRLQNGGRYALDLHRDFPGGRRLLAFAFDHGKYVVAAWLVDNGADPFIRDWAGQSVSEKLLTLNPRTAAADRLRNAIARAAGRSKEDVPAENRKFEKQFANPDDVRRQMMSQAG